MVIRTIFSDRRDVRSIQPQQRRRGMNPTHTGIVAWHAVALAYYFYTSLMVHCAQPTAASRLVDLSHIFDESTIYWVTTKRLDFTVTHNGTAPGDDYWYQSDEIAAGTHGGTHMDSPCHFALGRWCINDIPIERLAVPAAIVDISKDVGDDPMVHLTQKHLMDWEKTNGKIPDGSLLLIRTGWSRFWPDPLTYTGTVERNVSLLKFPSILAEAAKWLVDNRGIVGIGIDVMSIDVPGSVQTHITLMDKNIYGLENVNLRDPLPPTGVKIYALPMKLKGASGAPCRVLAEVSDGMTNGNVASSNSFSLWTIAALAVFWTLS